MGPLRTAFCVTRPCVLRHAALRPAHHQVQFSFARCCSICMAQVHLPESIKDKVCPSSIYYLHTLHAPTCTPSLTTPRTPIPSQHHAYTTLFSFDLYIYIISASDWSYDLLLKRFWSVRLLCIALSSLKMESILYVVALLEKYVYGNCLFFWYVHCSPLFIHLFCCFVVFVPVFIYSFIVIQVLTLHIEYQELGTKQITKQSTNPTAFLSSTCWSHLLNHHCRFSACKVDISLPLFCSSFLSCMLISNAQVFNSGGDEEIKVWKWIDLLSALQKGIWQ